LADRRFQGIPLISPVLCLGFYFEIEREVKSSILQQQQEELVEIETWETVLSLVFWRWGPVCLRLLSRSCSCC
jgi:hypothetical protein